MQAKRVLIVCFDVPFPTNYGGVYDVMSRISFLKKSGYIIDLICLCEDARRAEQFNSWIKKSNFSLGGEAFVLRSKPRLLDAFSLLPLSMKFREHTEVPASLTAYVAEQNYAFVLVEHLKTSLFAFRLNFRSRGGVFLRMHNNESEFYFELFKSAKSFLKKLFYFSEAFKYKYAQRKILPSDFWAGIYYISTKDEQSCAVLTLNSKILPTYTDLQNAEFSANYEGRVTDFLYVGNLDSDDNLLALVDSVRFINSIVFSRPIRIAVVGKCSTTTREKEVKNILKINHGEVEFHPNLSLEALKTKYNESKFFLNFSRNSGGVKTKLIDAFANGVMVISDKNGCAGSG